jgi:hypothetical protein
MPAQYLRDQTAAILAAHRASGYPMSADAYAALWIVAHAQQYRASWLAAHLSHRNGGVSC